MQTYPKFKRGQRFLIETPQGVETVRIVKAHPPLAQQGYPTLTDWYVIAWEEFGGMNSMHASHFKVAA